MQINKQDITIEYFAGSTCGGQRANKVQTNVRITHLPTGIVVTIKGRYRNKNKKLAMQELVKRLEQAAKDKVAGDRKAHRDEKIKPQMHIRTYDYKSGRVKDHRTGKTASVKDVVGKGKIELLR